MVPGLTVSSTDICALYKMLGWGRAGGKFSQLHLVNQKTALLHIPNSLISFFPFRETSFCTFNSRSLQGDLIAIFQYLKGSIEKVEVDSIV